VVTGSPHRDQAKDDDGDAYRDKLQNRSQCSHFSDGLTARCELRIALAPEGRSGCAEGRANSPVLNARALAVV